MQPLPDHRLGSLRPGLSSPAWRSPLSVPGLCQPLSHFCELRCPILQSSLWRSSKPLPSVPPLSRAALLPAHTLPGLSCSSTPPLICTWGRRGHPSPGCERSVEASTKVCKRMLFLQFKHGHIFCKQGFSCVHRFYRCGTQPFDTLG